MEEKEIVAVIGADTVSWEEEPELPGLGIQMLVVEEPEIFKITKGRLKPGSSLSAVYCYSEYLYMLKGEITFSWEGKKVVAKVGDTVCIEPRGKHCAIRWENTGKEPAEVFVAIEPIGVQGERGLVTPERFKEIAETL